MLEAIHSHPRSQGDADEAPGLRFRRLAALLVEVQGY